MKKRVGDRRDAIKLRNLDSFHVLLPFMMPKRCDSTIMISADIDAGSMKAYAKAHDMSVFTIIVAGLVRIFALRPHLNRYILNKKFYQRHKVDVGFVAKKRFADDASESVVRIAFEPNSTINTVKESLEKAVNAAKGDTAAGSDVAVDFIGKLPKPILAFVMFILRRLISWDIYPLDMFSTDPNFSSVFLANLGSIKAEGPFHHINEWGTNSLFISLGEIKPTPYVDSDGNIAAKDMMNIKITFDERLSDGFYMYKSFNILQNLLQNPELLEVGNDGGE